ncbi:Opt1p, partial [Candida maltosa Xu316]
SYDRFQQTYNVSRIVDTTTLSFNEAEYKKYSPLFLSTTFAISYGLSFASILATLTHTICFHGKDLVNQFRQKDKPDVHNRLMKSYKKAPEWWFLVIFLIFFGMAVATVRAWPTEMPVWSLVLALLIGIVFLLPVTVIYAKTNIQVGLNVISEFVVGYLPHAKGNPVSMMQFKTYCYISNIQALTYAQDMKLGHYMKIAPRLLFFCQLIATIWGSLVQIAVLQWAYGSIEGLCEPDQKNHYTCPNGKVFFNASIIWGVIGPERQFSKGQIYYGLLFFFIVGAVTPIINWLILKKWPNSPIRHLHWPVFFSGTGYIPPATPYNYTSYCAVGLFFGWWVKKKWFHWWSKYNYSLSAGLDIGLAWSSLLIFLCLGLTNANFPSWWGNDVINTTLDSQVSTNIRHILNEGEAFGPSSW